MAGQYKNTCPKCFEDSFANGVCKFCGYYEQDINPIALQNFTLLNKRYLTGKILGIGGFGITYIAKDISTNTLCAIKEYLPSELVSRNTQNQHIKVGSPSNAKIYAHGQKRFFEEAQMLSSFSNKKGIVKVFGYFRQNNTAYLVMEYLEGVTLRRLVASGKGPLRYETAYKILIDLSEALKKVHAKGVLHRDISPENIFLTKEEQVKLIDFGASRYYIGERSQNLSVVLKHGFAPIEQYASKGNQGPWTDIYALACTFYFTFSRTNVVSANDRLNGKTVLPLHRLNKSVPKEISRVIEKAMEINPKSRHQDMFEFLQDLRGTSRSDEYIDKDIVISSVETEISPTPGFFSWIRDIMRRNFGGFSGAMKSVDRGKIPQIEGMCGPQKGMCWYLHSNVPVQLGRSGNHCEIVVRHSIRISRIHCILWYDEVNGSFFIQDCSRNGTFAGNGEKFENGRRYMLDSGDEFYLATRDNAFRVGLK